MTFPRLDFTDFLVALINILPPILALFIDKDKGKDKDKDKGKDKGKDKDKGKKGKPSNGYVRKATLYKVIAVVVLLDVLVFVIPFLLGPSLEISSPSNNASVEGCFFVNGTHKRMPGNKVPWLIVQTGTSDHIFPQSRLLLSQDGSWSGKVCVGTTKEQYAIIAVLVSESTDDEFYMYMLNSENDNHEYKGIRDIPADVEEFARILVVNKEKE